MNAGGAPNASPRHSTANPARSCQSRPVSATDGSAPGPCISSHSGSSRSKAVGSLFSPRLGLGRGCSRLEKPSQHSEVPGAGYGGRVRRRKPLGPPESPGRSQRSRGEPPAGPGMPWGAGRRGWERWGGGPVAGEAGPAVLHGRGKWGPGEGRGAGRTAPVRRRTPPACWASGRPPRWLASAPPRSSCPRLSSSFGTA